MVEFIQFLFYDWLQQTASFVIVRASLLLICISLTQFHGVEMFFNLLEIHIRVTENSAKIFQRTGPKNR